MQDPILTPIFTAALTSAAVAAEVTVSATVISTTASILSTATLIAGSVAISYLMAPKPRSEAGHSALRQPISPVFAGRGECRLAGAYVLFGQKERYSLDVLAFHNGRIGGIVGYYLFDDPVELDGSNEVVTPDPPGDNRYDEGSVTILHRLGLPTETAYSEIVTLLPDLWTADHRGDDTASIAVIAGAGQEKSQAKFFPLGRPEPSVRANLAPVFDGRDPTQDPDDDTTFDDYPAWDLGDTYAEGDRVTQIGAVYISRESGNIGLAPRDNQDSWVRVDTNPILGLSSYLTDTRNGLGLSYGRHIAPVLDRLLVEADKCDVLVDKKNGDVEARYTCSTWWNGETDPAEVIADFLASCDGWIDLDGDGHLALIAGVYEAPTCLPITDDEIVGLDIYFSSEDQERADTLTISFTSPIHKFKTVPGEMWPTAASIGKSLPFNPKGVTSHSQLRRLAKRQYARANTPIRGMITTHLGGLQWQGLRWVPIQSALMAELGDAIIEVRKMTRNFAARQCTIEFVLIDPATIDAFDPATEEGEAPPVPDDMVIGILPVPQDLDVDLVGDASTGQYLLSFDDLFRPDLTYAVQWRLVDDGTGSPGGWTAAQISEFTTAGGRTSFPFPIPVALTEEYETQVASVSSRATWGQWSISAFVPGSTDILLAEDGAALLAEDGASLLVEAAT